MFRLVDYQVATEIPKNRNTLILGGQTKPA